MPLPYARHPILTDPALRPRIAGLMRERVRALRVTPDKSAVFEGQITAALEAERFESLRASSALRRLHEQVPRVRPVKPKVSPLANIRRGANRP